MPVSSSRFSIIYISLFIFQEIKFDILYAPSVWQMIHMGCCLIFLEKYENNTYFRMPSATVLNGSVKINGSNQVIPAFSLCSNCSCRSRDEIAMWKEKQAQVIKEELRVRETIAKLAAVSKASTKGPSKQSTLVAAEVCCTFVFLQSDKRNIQINTCSFLTFFS